MDNSAIPETVLFCEKQVERPADGLRSPTSKISSSNLIERQLIWSSRKPDDWEILVYKQGEVWDACFFRWPIHHEHTSGSSFESVRQRAEQRIRVLEAGRLKATVWRQLIH